MNRRLIHAVLALIAWLQFSALIAQDVTSAPTTRDLTSDALQNILVTSVRDPQAAGVLKVTTSQHTWTAVTGLADFQLETPATVDARFRIGSIGKTFTAVIILQLVEEQQMGLDDPIRDWLPQEIVSQLANADTATVRQLLALRSGIPDYLEQDFFEAVLEDTSRTWTAEEVLPYAYGKPAHFPAGSDFYYSNTNYVLLQLIAERAAGSPFHTLIRDRIIEPLNLTNTYTQISEFLPGGFVDALGHWGSDQSLIEVTDYNDGAGLGDGGQVSNAADLTAFFRALLAEGRLLNAESLEAMQDFQPMDEPEGLFGLGLQAYQTPYGIAYGRHGNVMGFFSASIYLPEHDMSVTALYAIDTPDIFNAVMSAIELALES